MRWTALKDILKNPDKLIGESGSCLTLAMVKINELPFTSAK
jgi:hypothetical protein